MSRNEIDSMPKEPKPSISINDTTYSKVKELSMDDDVQIVANGRIVGISSNERYKSAKEPVKYTAEIQLEDIRVVEVGSGRKVAGDVARMLNIKK